MQLAQDKTFSLCYTDNAVERGPIENMQNERKELDKTMINEVVLNNSKDLAQKHFVEGILYEDIMSYLPEMKQYVEGTLLAALTMEIDMDKIRERRNKMLYEKLLANPELKNTIINELVKNGLAHTLAYSYKQNLSNGASKVIDGRTIYEDLSEDKIIENTRRTVFMREFYSYLSTYQIALKAEYLDKKIDAEKLAAEQTNRSR